MQLILILFLICNVVLANTIDIEYNNFKSKISYTKNEVRYIDANTNLGILAKNCNQKIVNHLNNIIKTNLVFKPAAKSEKQMTLKLDGKIFAIDIQSKEGQFYYDFIETMKTSKIQEMLSCK